ncbi:EMILIN-3 [Trichomycterus rosablanca]|uniref:EMILIN-3 n=1 Tax=Trichomycterus rosablanca TaxID=2290929 RepID=UPI002F352A65
MLWPDFLCPLFFVSVGIAVVDAFGAYRPNPNHFSAYNSEVNPNYSSGKPTARHKNHCAYVVEKSVSYTVQDGAAPYVKAEYKKCGYGKKCPAIKYRMFYKPKYKVAYKTMTELEWRCCPGFSGVGCTHGHALYGMKAMPPFKGPAPSYKGVPSQKGPQPSLKGPMPSYNRPMPSLKGPMPPFKRPMPSYKGYSNKGPMAQPNYNRNHWNQPLTPFNSMGGYPSPNVPPSYPETLYRPYTDPETDHLDPEPEQHNPLTNEQDSEHDQIPDGHEPLTDYQDALPAPQESVPETQAPSGDSELNHDTEENSATIERLNQMEEDVQRLSLGIETLRAKMTSLEDHLRASLREDTNRMISTILSAAPASAAAKSQDSVGFEQLSGGAPDPDIDGSDALTQLPNLGELAEKVAELQSILLSRSAELSEMKKTVLEHDNTLNMLNNETVNLTDSQALETMVDAKLSEAETTMFGRFEKHMKSAEERCDGRLTEVVLQCNQKIMLGQEQLEQVINSSVMALKNELRNFHADLQGLEPEDSCCIAMSGLTERLVLIEHSMDGLNQSQVHLRAELGGHRDHVEGMIEGRLGYVESILTTTEQQPGVGSRIASNVEVCLEEKIIDLENRLFAAIEELGNTTSPALSEGQVVTTLATEVEALKQRIEGDMENIQKQLGSLELLCTTSCGPQPVLTGYSAPLLTEEEDQKHNELNKHLSAQTERLDQLNTTLNSLLTQLAKKQDEKTLQGEVTLLKVSIHSVNHTLGGLKANFGKVVQKVGQTNLTWQEREERIAQQVKGVVQLVGQQASMLGAGERRLTRLKGELQDLRRRLAGELQTCRSTALGVQKEVNEVGGRVTRIEGQCGGLARLTEDLEMVRGELEKHTDGYFSQVNNTLLNHSLQLSELKEGLKNCSEVPGSTMSTGFITAGPTVSEKSTPEPPQPRGDQFMVPKQGRDEQELT